MNNCLVSILVYLGFLSLGWLPLWCYKLFRQYHQQMPAIFIKRLGQLFLAACVLIAFYQISTWVVIQYQLEDRGLIDAEYRNFRNALAEERYEDAYSHMTPEFRKNNTLSDFKEWIALNYFPELCPDRLVTISLFSSTAVLYPEYNIYGDFWQSTIILYWEEIDEKWYLTGEVGYALD